MAALYGAAARQAGIATETPHPDVRLRDLGPLRFIFNHGPDPVDVSAHLDGREVLIGAAMLEPCGVAVARVAGT
jgi:beta-galactosidase